MRRELSKGSAGVVLSMTLPSIANAMDVLDEEVLVQTADGIADAQELALDWNVLMIVTALGIAGSIAGAKIAIRIPQQRLKRSFRYFLIVMGVYILARSVPQALQFAA